MPSINNHAIHQQFSGVIAALLSEQFNRFELVSRLLEIERNVMALSALQQLNEEKNEAIGLAEQEIKSNSLAAIDLNIDRELDVDDVFNRLKQAMQEAERGEYV